MKPPKIRMPQDRRSLTAPILGIHTPYLLALLFTSVLPTPTQAQTLAHILETHTLRCATNTETPEYSTSDDHGPRQAFDAELCRAVAIAILGPAARLTLVPYPDDVTAAGALRSGAVDLIPTQTLDATHDDPAFTFTPPILFDGVGLLVPAAARLTQPAEFAGQKICFLAESQVETALRAWFAARSLHFVPFPFQEEGEMQAAFVTGNCAALAGDLTRLAETRRTLGPLASRYTLLPGTLAGTDDPLAAATLAADPAFAAIVRWTFQLLLHAEAAHLTQTPASPVTPEAAALLAQARDLAPRLHLAPAWAANVLAATGNYAEIYTRTLAAQLPRGQNRLTRDGGLLTPIPFK